MKHETEVTSTRLRQEHHEMAELEMQLLKASAERTQVPARIAELFQAIYDRAVAHLQDEESGVIHKASTSAPNLARQCEQLCGDHQSLKTKLNRLLKLTEKGLGTVKWWNTLEKEFHEFVVELNQHESLGENLINEIEETDCH